MCFRILNIFFTILVIHLNVSAESPTAKKEINLLIVDGFSNHDWYRTTNTIVHLLHNRKEFKIVVSTSPDHTANIETIESWSPEFSAYDVVLLNCNDKYNPVNWSTKTRQNLEKFVASGGGLYIFHSANNGFVNWPEYNKMIGLGWRQKTFGKALVIEDDGALTVVEAGDGEDTMHGKRVNALVHRIGNHPIQKKFPKSWIYADIEIYAYARGPMEKMTVLTYAKDSIYKKNFPVEWVVKYGKGNVYNSTLGHFWKDQQNPESMRCAAFQTELVRALQWLAKTKIDTRVPEDFPGAITPSLRDNINTSALAYENRYNWYSY